ncbi:uncharacterized protein LOC141535798 isoform X1 [Cotesia typhae]|uniref:uncharacterized protein LOC141535798 isoform X1 n=1 Tax=Cotesia typhae TaxID=2053667 RepID=UPI003D6822FA
MFHSESFADLIFSEMNIHEDIVKDNQPYTFSHPLYFYSLFIVTHNSRPLSPLEKIYNYYDYLILISTIIILVITFVIIYLSGYNIAFATFEILRLLINTGITVRIDTTKIRIFFSVIFLYFLIIHGTFSGRLAGFLTRFEYGKNVDTIEDLKDSRYKIIYAHPVVEKVMKNMKLQNKTEFMNFYCSDYIKNESIACIHDYYELLHAIRLFDLHQSREPILSGFKNYLVRKNWPLKERFNDVLIWLMHSGISQVWIRTIANNDIHRIERRKALAVVEYRSITFADLGFSFVVLGIGWALALLAFFSEIFFGRSIKKQKCRKVKKVRIKRLISITLVKVRISRIFNRVVRYLREQ